MDRHQKIRKQVGLVGAIVGSLVIASPGMAMVGMKVDQQVAQGDSSGSGSATNPHPKIFDEPPYNHSGATSGSGGTPSMMQPMPQSGMSPTGESKSPASSNSPSSTSIENPNPPASNPSPYEQLQHTGGATQPRPKPGEGNPNPPATNPSPYLRQQHTGDSTQPGSSKSMGKQNSPVGKDASVSSLTRQNQADTGRLPTTIPADGNVSQVPLPEQQQPSSGMVTPINGKVNVNLVNETGATVNYELVGNTTARSLPGKSNVMLQNLPTPLTLNFQRSDHGLVKVSLQSPKPGMLNVNLTPTTDLSQDKLSMRVQKTGAIFLN